MVHVVAEEGTAAIIPRLPAEVVRGGIGYRYLPEIPYVGSMRVIEGWDLSLEDSLLNPVARCLQREYLRTITKLHFGTGVQW